jgi:hypothetical protein
MNSSEMVIINDSPDVEYVLDHPNIRIINTKERFSSVGKKLQWGFTQCKYDWVYRLDDDDLLSPYALELNELYRNKRPDADILRDLKHYYYSDNKFLGLGGSVNNGNCYSKRYIKQVGEFEDRSVGEDGWLTFNNNANIYQEDFGRYTMIYRWGMGVYHISGMGERPSHEIYEITDRSNTESGIINLNPKFNSNYWEQLPDYHSQIPQ